MAAKLRVQGLSGPKDRREPRPLSVHVRSCLLVRGASEAVAEQMAKDLSVIHPTVTLPPLPPLEAVHWLMPPSTSANRFLLQSVGEWTAILSNGLMEDASAWAFRFRDVDVHLLEWRPEVRRVYHTRGEHTVGLLQLLRDSGWEFCQRGSILSDRFAESVRAPKAANRLPAEVITAYFEELTDRPVGSLWSESVHRLEQRRPFKELPYPFIDDLETDLDLVSALTASRTPTKGTDHSRWMTSLELLAVADDASFSPFTVVELNRVLERLEALAGQGNLLIELTRFEGVEGAPVAERIWLRGVAKEKVMAALGEDAPDEITKPAKSKLPAKLRAGSSEPWLCLWWDG